MRSILTKSIFSRILGSKVGVRVLYSCGLYSAVYGMIFSNKGITKVLISLGRCAGWSAPLLFKNPWRQVSRFEAHIFYDFLFKKSPPLSTNFQTYVNPKRCLCCVKHTFNKSSFNLAAFCRATRTFLWPIQASRYWTHSCSSRTM